jgi:general secretion pathway protein E
LGIPFVSSLLSYRFVREGVEKIPYSLAKARLILPVDEEEGFLIVAMADPLDLEGIEEVRCHTGRPLKEIGTSKKGLEEALEKCYHRRTSATTELVAALREEESGIGRIPEGYDLLDRGGGSPAVELLNAVLAEAIQQAASDIHFEPMDDGIVIRYRIDGVLQMRHTAPKGFEGQLLTRLKVMARLDIAQSRLPQDGRIKLFFGGRQIDFRLSTIPVVHGERVVLRILDRGNILLGLEQLGMRKDLLSQMRQMIGMSEGIVLVTGPTGSGKTTTLYSAVAELSSSEVNIMTIEDPVEYKLSSIAQVGVNPKIDLDFARGLRHILRQDPDVIMVGEIRDRETAEIAIQSSLTGHLVLSTLHTNDAPSAITRLVDMGIEPYLLSSSVIGVIAQRLVRKICPSCRSPYDPSPEEIRVLHLPSEQPLFRGLGCTDCFETGYKGRCGIYEVMPLTDPIRKQLLKSADAAELGVVALESGMVSLRDEGILLALQGVTTVAEVLRVGR